MEDGDEEGRRQEEEIRGHRGIIYSNRKVRWKEARGRKVKERKKAGRRDKEIEMNYLRLSFFSFFFFATLFKGSCF